MGPSRSPPPPNQALHGIPKKFEVCSFKKKVGFFSTREKCEKWKHKVMLNSHEQTNISGITMYKFLKILKSVPNGIALFSKVRVGDQSTKVLIAPYDMKRLK